MSQKIKTTFGLVTVFKNNTEKKSNEIRKIETNVKSESDLKEIPKESIKIEKQNENFFGIEENTTKKNVKELEDVNYLDEQILKDYKNQKEDSNDFSNIRKQIKMDIKDLNYIDSYYFNKNDSSAELNSDDSKIEHITISDIKSVNNLNYFDEMVFQSEQDDKTIGSILSLKQENISKSHNKKKQVDEIPLISTNEFADDEEHNERKFRSISIPSSTEKKLKESKHKELDKEVPKWYDLTIDEAANILKNHVCYLNEERKFLLFQE